MAGARYIEAMLRYSPTDIDRMRSMLSRIAVLGAQQEAIAIAEYVVVMDPLCAQCQYQLARLYHNNGRFAEAESAARAALILLPSAVGVPIHRTLGRTLFFTGRFEEALEFFEQANDPGGRAAAIHALGRSAEFEAALQDAVDRFGENLPEGIAWIHAAIGDNEAVFEWLAKPPGRHPMSRARELEAWAYRSLHEDPRFVALQEGLGVSPAQLAALEFQPPLPPGVTVD